MNQTTTSFNMFGGNKFHSGMSNFVYVNRGSNQRSSIQKSIGLQPLKSNLDDNGQMFDA